MHPFLFSGDISSSISTGPLYISWHSPTSCQLILHMLICHAFSLFVLYSYLLYVVFSYTIFNFGVAVLVRKFQQWLRGMFYIPQYVVSFSFDIVLLTDQTIEPGIVTDQTSTISWQLVKPLYTSGN